MASFRIGDRFAGDGYPTYFIADITANLNGSLVRAKRQIRFAAQAGADAVKFQHFQASKVVSDYGFRALGVDGSRQSSRNSLVETYDEVSLPWAWTSELKTYCDEHAIEFLSTPYDFEAADMLDDYVQAYKIGSGDITWLEMLEYVARKKKPVILSTGASSMAETRRAVDVIRTNAPLALLQCNSSHAACADSFDHVHLNVLQSYRAHFPGAVLGLSDHTMGHAAVLGAVTLGARIVEKHFTDDTGRVGPDHGFSMTPDDWAEMVERTRELERALGSMDKFVADNEREAIITNRRCLRFACDLQVGHALERSDIDVLRPAPHDAIPAYELDQVIGRPLLVPVFKGEHLRWSALNPVIKGQAKSLTINERSPQPHPSSLDEEISNIERLELARCWEQGCSIVETARQLGTSRGRVYRLAKKLGPWPWRAQGRRT